MGWTTGAAAPRGGVAAGWTLDLPRVERDPSTGTLGAQNFTATLGGASRRLVRVTEIARFGGTTWRLEQDEGFARFELTGGRWIASTPDGVVHHFGSTPASGDGTTRWQLDQQVDAYRNAIQYEWEVARDSTGFGVDYTLRSISYTAHPASGGLPSAAEPAAIAQACAPSERRARQGHGQQRGRYGAHG